MTRTSEYFEPHEFVRGGVDWLPLTSERLIERLDAFRHAWGKQVLISQIGGALGRHGGPNDTSQHNVDKWREVRAADVLLPDMRFPKDRKRAFEIAKACGFTGIGVSPIWKPYQGMHVDVRESRKSCDPATWSYARAKSGKQIMVGLDSAFI